MNYEQMLLDAVSGNDIESAQHLLKSGCLKSVNGTSNTTTPLVAAISQGNMDMCKILLKHGACVNQESFVKSEHVPVIYSDSEYKTSPLCWADSEYKTSPLCWAVSVGYENVARILLQNSAKVNATDSGGNTPLHVAAMEGNLNVCRLLIKKCADVNYRRHTDKCTALMLACGYGYSNIVKELIKAGASLEMTNRDNKTALHFAAVGGHIDIVTILLGTEQKKLGSHMYSDNSVVHAACKFGNLEVMKILRCHGFSLVESDEDGCTPLYYAAKENHLNIVQYLLHSGVKKINCCDATGETALCHAIENGSVEMVHLLVKAGCSVNSPCVPYRPPLLRPKALSSPEIIKLLVENGADVNVEDLVGSSPLLLAGSLLTNISVLECLLYNGADILHRNAEGLDLLLVLIRYIRSADNWPQKQSLLEFALRSGCVVSSTNRYGMPALHMCLITKCMDFLLEHGADINQSVHHGCGNALANAADRGNLFIMEYLINHGINVNTKNNKGFSPLYYAVYHDNLNAVKLLVKAGADAATEISIGDVSMNLLECGLAFSRSYEICLLLYKGGAYFRPLTKSLLTLNTDGFSILLFYFLSPTSRTQILLDSESSWIDIRPDAYQSPSKLSDMSRMVIRESVGYKDTLINKLPLPFILKQFLNFEI